MNTAAGLWQSGGLWDILMLPGSSPVAFVGAGGKSAALRLLAEEAKMRGCGAVLTVTTKLSADQADMADELIYRRGSEQGFPQRRLDSGRVVLAAEEPLTELGKIRGLSPDEVCRLAREYPALPFFIEADGASGAGLKIPGENEPLIPDCCRTVVALTGYPVLNAAASEAAIHRREGLAGFREGSGETIIDPALMRRLLSDPAGSFKGAPETAWKVWLINGADSAADIEKAACFAEEVMRPPAAADMVVAGSLRGGGELLWRRQR
jgi:probable selenium-dependent hydroxylase accessory protein YqeC